MAIQEAWNRLCSIKELAFEAKSHAVENAGWNGIGRGVVHVEQVDCLTMVFNENGSWTPAGGRPIAFSNVFRWTADFDARLIRLEHLRFGPKQPVYLFDLVPVSQRVWESSEPHVCREDLYTARMEYDLERVELSWTIAGPKKDEKVSYTYK